MSVVKDLKEFASLLYDLQRSDRDNNIAVAGFTGEGKSCFLTLLFFMYGIVTGRKWSFDLMTWSRKELMEWIDGKPGTKKGRNGLKPGQKPEYTALLPDELFLLFYRRTWFDDDQIDAISTLNTCRDRHLLIGGGVPNFWDLDGAFQKRIRFYIYIHQRGKAWIFEQDNNPFNKDPWNVTLNKKLFLKYGKQPYRLPNFVAEIKYPDWTPRQKAEYYRIRNEKRVKALQEEGKKKKEKYKDIKEQRDKLINYIFAYEKGVKDSENPKLTNEIIGEVVGLSRETIRLIRSQ